MGILIQNVELEGKVTDIRIEGNLIKEIGVGLPVTDELLIDGRKKAVIPGFVNTHTHAAMTFFRGLGDDMPLMPWLKEKIWPNEAKLSKEDIYWGAKLACLEMIKSGTTSFWDMYYHPKVTAGVVEEIGLRCMLSCCCFDHLDAEQTENAKESITKFFAGLPAYSSRVRFSMGPHAIYTVSGKLLQWVDAFSKEHGVPIHLHLGETETEVADSVTNFGFTPVRYLEHLGVLSPHLHLAHGIYIDDEEVQILADHGVSVAHNPASNMKLASGMAFKFDEMRAAGIPVGLGTDGCASSNNLDMVEAMKLASLLGKVWRKDSTAVSADAIFESATLSGAKIMGIHGGRVKEGMLADLCLVDLHSPVFTPNFNFISNLVYAANGSCIDTVICDGKVLMQNRKVAGEDEILEEAAKRAFDLVKR